MIHEIVLSPSILLVPLAFVAFIGFGIWMYRWQYRRADELLRRWAAEHAFEVLEKVKANPLYTGPGHWAARDKRVVYRIAVKDSGGHAKHGVARLGEVATGTLGDKVEVEWTA